MICLTSFCLIKDKGKKKSFLNSRNLDFLSNLNFSFFPLIKFLFTFLAHGFFKHTTCMIQDKNKFHLYRWLTFKKVNQSARSGKIFKK